MPALKSAQDRMIEYFVGAPLDEAAGTLKTAGVILRARQAGVRQGVKRPVTAEAGEKRKPGRPKKADKPTGAMPPGARPAADPASE